MFENSIEQFIHDAQAPFFIDNKVYCPMCECLHENNTLCQLSMDGGFHE